MRIFPVLMLSLALAACATQLGVRDRSDLHRQMFSQIVFSPTYDSRKQEYLAKWTGPLIVALDEQAPDALKKYKGTATDQMKVMEKLTGLKVSLATESKPANVTIHFTTLNAIQTLPGSAAIKSTLPSTGCETIVSKNSAHRITGARMYVLINPGAEEVKLMSGTYNTEVAQNEKLRVHYCLVKGFAEIMGIRNSSDLITPSIFNTSNNISKPTSLDLKMIRTLYDPALKPGMTRTQALAAAEPILNN